MEIILQKNVLIQQIVRKGFIKILKLTIIFIYYRSYANTLSKKCVVAKECPSGFLLIFKMFIRYYGNNITKTCVVAASCPSPTLASTVTKTCVCPAGTYADSNY